MKKNKVKMKKKKKKQIKTENNFRLQTPFQWALLIDTMR